MQHFVWWLVFSIVITRNIWQWRNILLYSAVIFKNQDGLFGLLAVFCFDLRLHDHCSVTSDLTTVTSSACWWKKFVFVSFELIYLITEQQRDDSVKSETSSVKLTTTLNSKRPPDWDFDWFWSLIVLTSVPHEELSGPCRLSLCKWVNSTSHQSNCWHTRGSFCSPFGVNTDGRVFKWALL